MMKVITRCMRNLLALSLLVIPFISFSQNIPLVQNNAWLLRAGVNTSFPLTGTYHDFSLVNYSDYFWEYNVTPRFSAAPFIEVNRVVHAEFPNDNIGFYSYGLSWKQAMAGVDYTGWEGGGNSGVFYEGRGTKSWRDDYVQGQFRITHQFGLGKNYRPVLNSLGLSAGFHVRGVVRKEFTGSFNNGPEYSEVSVIKSTPDKWYIPQLKLNYTFSWVIKTEKFLEMPEVETALLFLNNFLQLDFPDHAPLVKHGEYYKEIFFSVALMRR